MEGYAGRGVAIGDSARNAKMAQSVEQAERELDVLTGRIRDHNGSLNLYINNIERFLSRTFPPQLVNGQASPPDAPAPDAHLSRIKDALHDCDTLLARLSACVDQLDRLG